VSGKVNHSALDPRTRFGNDDETRAGADSRPMKLARRLSLVLPVAALLVLASGLAWAGPDATGAATGGAADVPAAVAGHPTLGELATELGHHRVAINMTWAIVAAALVMFMQAGFAMVETGLTRAKNAAHTMAMNLAVYGVGMLAFWAVGFALEMGGVGALGTFAGPSLLDHEVSLTLAGHSFGLFGAKGFALTGDAVDVGVLAMFVFQMVFMDTSATIPTGALAERWRFAAFLVFSVFVAGVIYPIHANWIWGGGWLSTLGKEFHLGHGVVDFAGSSVVHLTGGVLAFVTCRAMGPRLGRFDARGRPRPIAAHNVPMAIIGTIILAFGWFGFNAGSTLAGTDLRLAVVAVNTMLASGAAMVTAMLYTWKVTGKPDPTLIANGMLAGLVAITAPCAFVTPLSAVIIGSIAGVLVIAAFLAIEQKLKIDDPVGACAVHGVCGAFGTLCVGIFADGKYGDGLNGVPGPVTGLVAGGGFAQLGAQLIGVVVNVTWVGAAGLAAWWITAKLVGPHRVRKEVEIEGLDVNEMGLHAYPAEEAHGLGG
jgi:Amt family ammonium transporter